MFHETIRALAEAGLLLAAGVFASKLGFLENLDVQVWFSTFSAIFFAGMLCRSVSQRPKESTQLD